VVDLVWSRYVTSLVSEDTYTFKSSSVMTFALGVCPQVHVHTKNSRVLSTCHADSGSEVATTSRQLLALTTFVVVVRWSENFDVIFIAFLVFFLLLANFTIDLDLFFAKTK
jgi:hypothetical protein